MDLNFLIGGILSRSRLKELGAKRTAVLEEADLEEWLIRRNRYLLESISPNTYRVFNSYDLGDRMSDFRTLYRIGNMTGLKGVEGWKEWGK